MNPTQIAQVCHEANRGLQAAAPSPGIPVAAPWDELDEHTRDSAVDGVQAVLNGADPRESHENWCRFKLDAGWRYGEVKDFDQKTHPCLVPYADLSDADRIKDDLFVAVVEALS
jgi:hypothetical protein